MFRLSDIQPEDFSSIKLFMIIQQKCPENKSTHKRMLFLSWFVSIRFYLLKSIESTNLLITHIYIMTASMFDFHFTIDWLSPFVQCTDSVHTAIKIIIWFCHCKSLIMASIFFSLFQSHSEFICCAKFFSVCNAILLESQMQHFNDDKVCDKRTIKTFQETLQLSTLWCSRLITKSPTEFVQWYFKID